MALKDRDVDLFDDDEDEDEDTQENKYLTFTLAEEEFAIAIYFVIEIIGIQGITEVPDCPHFVKGVINLRGKVIPVMDVRLRFNFKERAYDGRTCIVVINVDNHAMGLIVDGVSEVLNIPTTDIEPTPELRRGKHNRFISAMGKAGEKVILILDTEKMLFDEMEDIIKEGGK